MSVGEEIEWIAVNDRLPPLMTNKKGRPVQLLIATRNGEIHRGIFVEILGVPRFFFIDAAVRERLRFEPVTQWALEPNSSIESRSVRG